MFILCSVWFLLHACSSLPLSSSLFYLHPLLHLATAGQLVGLHSTFSDPNNEEFYNLCIFFARQNNTSWTGTNQRIGLGVRCWSLFLCLIKYTCLIKYIYMFEINLSILLKSCLESLTSLQPFYTFYEILALPAKDQRGRNSQHHEPEGKI